MSRLPEKAFEGYIQNREVVFSVGGSTLFEDNWRIRVFQNTARLFGVDMVSVNLSKNFVGGFLCICEELIKREKSPLIVVGGGKVARMRMDDVLSFGSNGLKNDQLDWIGINETRANASHLLGSAQRRGLPATWHSKEMWGNEPDGYMLARGGTSPRHTTDVVGAEMMRASGAGIMINITNVKGVYETNRNGKLDRRKIIPLMTHGDYVYAMGLGHIPGRNTPFEPEASIILNEIGKAVVIVSGDDMDNLSSLFAGKDFVGTVLVPDSWMSWG